MRLIKLVCMISTLTVTLAATPVCSFVCQAVGDSNQSACKPIESQIVANWENGVFTILNSSTPGYGVAITRFWLDEPEITSMWWVMGNPIENPFTVLVGGELNGHGIGFKGKLNIGESATFGYYGQHLPYSGKITVEVSGIGGPEYKTLFVKNYSSCCGNGNDGNDSGVPIPEPNNVSFIVCLAVIIYLGFHSYMRYRR